MMIEITSQTFAQEVMNDQGTVLVKFGATWCGPCKLLTPLLEKVSKEFPTVKFCAVDVGNDQQLPTNFHVQSVPTVILFKGGKVVDRFSGVPSPDKIKSFITKNI
jgi:thioredoxin 1